MSEEPLVDPAAADVLIPLDEWPTVEPEPVPKVTSNERRRQKRLDAKWTAREDEARRYAEDVARATEGLEGDALTAWCAAMEEWNDAVAGGPRHA